MTAPERFHTIETAVGGYAVSFLAPLKSKQALAHAYRAHQDFDCYCQLDLKKALERQGFLTYQKLKLDL